MPSPLGPVIVAVVGCVLVLGGWIFLLSRCYRTVKPGTALVISMRARPPLVLFSGGFMVLPGLHSAAVLDMTERRLELRFDASSPLSLKGSERAEATVELRFRPVESLEDVMGLVKHIGVDRLNDVRALEMHYSASLRAIVVELASNVSRDELGKEDFSDALAGLMNEALTGFDVVSVAVVPKQR